MQDAGRPGRSRSQWLCHSAASFLDRCLVFRRCDYAVEDTLWCYVYAETVEHRSGAIFAVPDEAEWGGLRQEQIRICRTEQGYERLIKTYGHVHRG